MAPEQVQCRPVDHRSDIYSLGLVAYEMATGQKPFSGDNTWEIMERYANEDIPDPTDLAPDLPSALRDFILKACARSPGERFQSIAEVLNCIDPLIRQHDPANGAVTRPARKMRSFYLVYGDENRNKLDAIIDDLSLKLQRAGIQFKAGDRIDI